MTRPSVADTMMAIASVVATSSTCPRLQVGAVIADARGVVARSGFNGAPVGMPHCSHPVDQQCVTAVHAELNALLRAARDGVPVAGLSMWTTDSPCYGCASAIIQAGIVEVSYGRLYRDTSGLQLLAEAGVRTWHVAGVGVGG